MLACSKQANDAAPMAAPTPAPTPAKTAATAPTGTPAPAGVESIAPAAAAEIPAEPAPAFSSDPDNPIALPSLQIVGVGAGKAETRYFDFDAGAGPITVTATAKNSPSGATQALGFALYDTQANRLCFDSLGNTTVPKTVELHCQVEQAQRLLLRLDLSPESIGYAVTLTGPVTLIARAAAATEASAAGAGSTDIDAPTKLATNRVRADGPGKPVSYYYTFNAGPGELTLTGDGRNSSAGVTEALQLGLYTLRSERICELNLGNTTLDKRAVTTCVLDKREPVILRADLSAETIGFRARFDGPYDFEPYTAPKHITIALDSSVMFDTGKSTIKTEAREELHEVAERIKKFDGASIDISGHTDNVGSQASNKTLSAERAEAVKAYFAAEGIDHTRMKAQGFGASQPIADNGTDAGRARNRRVDVVIVPSGAN
jgi:outer membrane protein OmpA-like peptidoglycan-associated protein